MWKRHKCTQKKHINKLKCSEDIKWSKLGVCVCVLKGGGSLVRNARGEFWSGFKKIVDYLEGHFSNLVALVNVKQKVVNC